jgi:SEFIR domain-containing protein
MTNPTAFISYSHDSTEHADRVLELSNRLRADGIDCTIDQYEVSPAEGWPKWMDRQIAKSDFVLVVCTETYYRRVTGEEEKGKGLGIKWESTITFQDIYDEDSRITKFIPVLFDGGKTDFIPKPIKGASRYILMEQYEDLYRHLTNQPKVKKPELGLIKKLEPLAERERKTDFFEGTTAAWHLAHPYPMPPNFTGRAIELKMLDDWLADNTNRLFILRALGGFGKSALAWQWINTHVNPAEWTKLVWWSFYEGDASFEHFIEDTLKYLKIEVPPGTRPQVDELLKAMQSQKILLIMDGFERVLRAYSSMNAAYQGDEPKIEDNQLDCVNINAEIFLKSICSLPNIKGKVIMTTRLTPRAIKPRGEFMLGCCEEELTSMQPADTVEFFHKQKIKGTHAEIEAACAPYGYHPLSLRILAGLIIDDRKTPGDISVANKLEITNDIVQNKHHVLEVAYNTLLPEQQKLLSMIACFRSPMNYDVLKEITSKPLGKGKRAKADSFEKLDDNLKTLETRGLLHWDRKANKYDLHPIVRRFAYDRLTASQRTDAHGILVIYFEAVPQPQKIEKLEDLAPVIELYHHMVRAGNLDEAQKLFYDRFGQQLHYQFGTYQLEIELLRALFLDGEDKLPRLKKEDNQAFILNQLANAYALSGQPSRAVPLYKVQNVFREKQGDKKNLAIGLGAVAKAAQLLIGELIEAEHNFRREIELGHEVEDEVIEALGHQEMGRVLSYRGAWQEAEQELDTGLKLFEKHHAIQSESIIWSYRALRFLLLARDNHQSSIVNCK